LINCAFVGTLYKQVIKEICCSGCIIYHCEAGGLEL